MLFLLHLHTETENCSILLFHCKKLCTGISMEIRTVMNINVVIGFICFT